MSHGHFVHKCVCGIVTAQCRCIDPNKTVSITEPCIHNITKPKDLEVAEAVKVDDQITCHITKQIVADHEYTVLYDKDGNKYLKLETFDLNSNFEPKF